MATVRTSRDIDDDGSEANCSIFLMPCSPTRAQDAREDGVMEFLRKNMAIPKQLCYK
jgi:hypothetical protein